MTPPNARCVYKIVPTRLWQAAVSTGEFRGSPIDLHDGYIHFSTARQLAETAAKHFAGQTDLLLVAIDDEDLIAKLRFEASRGGDLFPHLYGSFRVDQIAWVKPIRLGKDGRHEITLPNESRP